MDDITEILQLLENETHEQYCERIERLIDASPDNLDLLGGYAEKLLYASIDGIYRYNDEKIVMKMLRRRSFSSR